MRKTLLFVFFLCTLLNAEILETEHFCDLISHVTKDSLIILDVDDTLLIPEQMLGCDEWFISRLNRRKLIEGLPAPVALEKSLAEWEAIRHLTRMKVVEIGTVEIIRFLQDEGYCVIGLTTQGLALATRTYRQLKDNGIDLSLSAPMKKDLFIDFQEHGILYRKGILFTSGQPKGEALFSLCRSLGYEPKRIVFINDKASHLADIEITARKHLVPFIGLRYAYADLHKQAFDFQVAEFQFAHSTFERIITDEEAREILYRLASDQIHLQDNLP